jgi:valyl-tRNA synthetase
LSLVGSDEIHQKDGMKHVNKYLVLDFFRQFLIIMNPIAPHFTEYLYRKYLNPIFDANQNIDGRNHFRYDFLSFAQFPVPDHDIINEEENTVFEENLLHEMVRKVRNFDTKKDKLIEVYYTNIYDRYQEEIFNYFIKKLKNNKFNYELTKNGKTESEKFDKENIILNASLKRRREKDQEYDRIKQKLVAQGLNDFFIKYDIKKDSEDANSKKSQELRTKFEGYMHYAFDEIFYYSCVTSMLDTNRYKDKQQIIEFINRNNKAIAPNNNLVFSKEELKSKNNNQKSNILVEVYEVTSHTELGNILIDKTKIHSK